MGKKESDFAADAEGGDAVRGLSVFIEFLGKTGYRQQVSEHLPVRRKSPNAIDPGEKFTAFLISVVAGARRVAHGGMVRTDRALHVLLGMKRFPTEGTIRNLFKRFTQGMVVKMDEPLWAWQLARLPERVEGYSLDLDSTVFERYGKQEGGKRDYKQWACIKPRIEELKSDLAAGDFCLKEFFATEAAFLGIPMLFNLMGEFRRASGMTRYRQPARLRAQVFLYGAILGRAGHRTVLHLSSAWGGLEKRHSLFDKILEYEIPNSRRLELQPCAPG